MISSARPSGSTAHTSGYRRKLILSVDDEWPILESREIVLAMAGYQVLSAIHGRQALEILAANAVDLVLLDYVMPGLDGGAVAREIKKSRPDVPVILVSASPIPDESLACIDALLERAEDRKSCRRRSANFCSVQPDSSLFPRWARGTRSIPVTKISKASRGFFRLTYLYGDAATFCGR